MRGSREEPRCPATLSRETRVVTKKEIVKAISDELGLTQLKTKEIVQKTFEAIIETLVKDPSHRIELRNFGVFEVKKRAARKARNPRTGEKVEVPAKYVVTFKPGKEMEERVSRIADQQPQKERPEPGAARRPEAPAAGRPAQVRPASEPARSEATPEEATTHVGEPSYAAGASR